MDFENEHDLETLELALPTESSAVFSQARAIALKAGLSVLLSKDGAIFRVTPDGNRKFIKRIEPPVEVAIGKKFKLP
jgi:hypothetical protein